MLKAAIPLLHVQSSETALAFYRDRLGFRILSTYRSEPGRDDPAYMVAQRDGALIHLSSFPGDGVAGGVVTVIVDDIVALHDDHVAKGIDVGNGIMDQSWGNREVYVRDPDGNSVRFQEG